MRFGKRAGKITNSPSGGTDWPRSIKPGETRVRFVEEIENWQEYWEHYDETVKFFPCTGDKPTCPGCTSASERTARASKKYLAPVLDPNSGRVYGLKMGMDLANRLSLRNDRNGGTITNRDYTLIRSGQGLDTEYDVEQEEKVAIDLSAYEGQLDLDEMLAAQFASAWPDFDPDAPTNTNGRVLTGTARSARTTDSTVEETPPPRKRAARKATPAVKTAPAKGTAELLRESAESTRAAVLEGSDDDPPSEAPAVETERAQEPTQADGETVEITEDDLQQMSRSDLIKLARQAELEVTLTMSREDIVKKFLEEFSV